MALRKIKLGDYLELYKQKCGNPCLDPYDVSGINRDKEFFEPSKQIGTDTSDYQNVPPRHFACNLMHVGRDAVLPIAYNHTDKTKHVSPAYTVFKIIDNNVLSELYFFLYLKSEEKDRFFWFNTDSSIRDGMTWDDLCNIEIELPDLETQKKFVSVYLGMLENQKAYETGLEDLKHVCDAYIEGLRREKCCERLENYIEEVFDSNKDGRFGIENIRGISIKKAFIETKADMTDVSLKPYLTVKPNCFSFVPVTSRNGEKITLALNSSDETYIVSSSYVVFKVKDEHILDPNYLFLFFNRTEFDRYARFNSWGSARETFNYSDLEDVQIPIPNINIQKSVAKLFKAYIERKEINEQLKQQLNLICPILIKGSIEEAKEA